MKSADYWLGKLSKLRVDRASGDPAPHKPLLLLVIFELAQEGLLPPKTLPLTPDLASRFMSYSTVVANRRPQRRMFAIRFTILAVTAFGRPWTRTARNRTTESGPGTWNFRRTSFSSPATPPVAIKARHLLIAKYFRPSERIALYELIGLPTPSDVEIEQNAAYKSAEDAMQVGAKPSFEFISLPRMTTPAH